MDRRLLVAGVDQAEVLVCDRIQQRQDVITGQGEDVFTPSSFSALQMR